MLVSWISGPLRERRFNRKDFGIMCGCLGRSAVKSVMGRIWKLRVNFVAVSVPLCLSFDALGWIRVICRYTSYPMVLLDCALP